ncbi:MAG: nucleotidyltransferase domain-containing protein [Ignavibacteria bacterium]
MASSLNRKLLELASEYYISHGSIEQIKIDTSVETLKSRLKSHFGKNILNIIEFGSYKRDTILPRQFDELSDVDLMIIFNHSSLQVSPGTYRNYLMKFAEERYSRSDVKKSSPTVVLELEHIKYDLVPAYIQENAFYERRTIFIPRNDSNWMPTDPFGFNTDLTTLNSRHNGNIKRTIRLLKAWNAKTGYPISSYELEKEIVGISYWGCSELEDYFFKAINDFNIFSPMQQKIEALKANALKVKNCLKNLNSSGALDWLSHILPT